MHLDDGGKNNINSLAHSDAVYTGGIYILVNIVSGIDLPSNL